MEALKFRPPSTVNSSRRSHPVMSVGIGLVEWKGDPRPCRVWPPSGLDLVLIINRLSFNLLDAFPGLKEH
jgi:hypothetical protein